mmetsp:Transcript_34623/g.99771  ORF Transcript_34623/g.99771 Transcript_34623/m.99771 type:complete len:375 (+) Transcript_34623:54-1178(+)
MGAGCSSSGSEDLLQLPYSVAAVPCFFREILSELLRHKSKLGGSRHSTALLEINGKIKAEEFKSAYTDFEYVYLTVLGLARLQMHRDEIVRKCNGRSHTGNPGVQLLEAKCGMTMHGDRPGAVALLRSAPDTLIQAFNVAKNKRDTLRFFREAFDRRADPCLEGRIGRILEYLEKQGFADADVTCRKPPWEDVSVKPLADTASVDDVVGEYLRVFVNECTWQWAEANGVDYETAKRDRLDAESFVSLCNASSFTAWMRAKGLVSESEALETNLQWEVLAEDWVPFEPAVNSLIEQARKRGKQTLECRLGPKGWTYALDLRLKEQRNPKTGKVRPIRCAPVPLESPAKRQLLPRELDASVRMFVEDLVTLPLAPS